MHLYNDCIRGGLSAQGHSSMARHWVFLPGADTGMDTGGQGDKAIEREASRVATYHRARIRRPRKNVE